MPPKVFKILAIAALLNAVLWGVVLTKFNRASTTTILHYSVDVGIDYIGEGGRVLILPIIGLSLLLLNSLLGGLLYKTEPRLSWPLWAITPILELLLLLSVILLITVNP